MPFCEEESSRLQPRPVQRPWGSTRPGVSEERGAFVSLEPHVQGAGEDRTAEGDGACHPGPWWPLKAL